MRRSLMVVAASVAVVLAGVGVSASTQAATQGRWVITDLGTLGGPYSQATALNDRGQIVGWADTKAKSRGYPISHAFLWQDGKMRDLGAVGGWSTAVAINERGQIVGESGVGLGYAFLWQNGKMRDLGAPGGMRNSSWAVAINDRGQIAGEWREAATKKYYGFIRQNGTMRDLGTFGEDTLVLGWHPELGESELGKAINNLGHVIGYSGTKYVPPDQASESHGFLWRDGKMVDLGKNFGPTAIDDRDRVIGCVSIRQLCDAFLWKRGRLQPLGMATAEDINDSGTVVGSLRDRRGRNLPSLWRQGKVQKLPIVFGDRGRAVALNNRGQVIGWTGMRAKTTTASRQTRHAFVWENGKTTDLPLLPGAKEAVPAAINNKGWIIGNVTMTSGIDTRAVLWTYKR